MKTRPLAIALLCMTWITSGCTPDEEAPTRAAGPHSTEEGSVTFWQVTAGLPLEYDACTDAATWRERIAAPEFSANSYLMYRVAAGGATALSQSCSTTGASSCTDGDRIWNVTGSVLTATDEPTETPQPGYDCDLRFDMLWRVTDAGETARLDVEMNMSLVGDQAACDTLDAAIAAEGTNSFGFNGCKVTIPVDMSFSHID